MPQFTVFERRIVWFGMISLTLFFLILSLTLSTGRFVTVLNGAFFGSSVSLVIAYWSLVKGIMFERRGFDRVDQAGLGFFLIWVAYLIAVGLSIYYRSSTYGAHAFVASAVSRYVAIVGTILLVTAPDFGKNPLYGRDRKVLFLGLLIGTVCAIGSIFLQIGKVLAE